MFIHAIKYINNRVAAAAANRRAEKNTCSDSFYVRLFGSPNLYFGMLVQLQLLSATRKVFGTDNYKSVRNVCNVNVIERQRLKQRVFYIHC